MKFIDFQNFRGLGLEPLLELANAVPPEQNVVILGAGVNFYYDDDSSETDGPRPVSLYFGQRAYFRSKKPNGCVQKMFVALKIQVGSSAPQNITKWIEDCPPDQCMLNRGCALSPNSFFTKGGDVLNLTLIY